MDAIRAGILGYALITARGASMIRTCQGIKTLLPALLRRI
jgi:hypothetical protein